MDNNQLNKTIYFASDFHLGVPSFENSLSRERKLVSWLSMASKDATEIFLLGDLFDFWFEYKYTVPKGYTRFLGKIAEIVDAGIPIFVFTGNHDMWMFDYLEKGIGVSIIRKPTDFTFNNKTFHIAHGDGLGPGDHSYKLIKKIKPHTLVKGGDYEDKTIIGSDLVNEIKIIEFFDGKSTTQIINNIKNI